MVESEETVSQEFPLLTRGLKRKGIKKLQTQLIFQKSYFECFCGRLSTSFLSSFCHDLNLKNVFFNFRTFR